MSKLPERTVDPQDVADWFLAHVDHSAGDSISHLKLQKLLYYAQAWSLVLLGEPLFAEDFQAWAHGPVLCSVYGKYRGASYEPLPIPPRRSVHRFGPEVEALLEDVSRTYGLHTAKALEDQTHREEPWLAARGDRPPGAQCRTVISKQAMREFFGAMFLDYGKPVIGPSQQGFRIGNPPFLGPDSRPLPPPDDDAFPPEDHDEFDRILVRGLGAYGRKRAQRRASRSP
jgi:uncharacterized phage-associated protein